MLPLILDMHFVCISWSCPSGEIYLANKFTLKRCAIYTVELCCIYAVMQMIWQDCQNYACAVDVCNCVLWEFGDKDVY